MASIGFDENGALRVNGEQPNWGMKNYIINGNFDVWQRGTSFQIPAGQSVYTADRWLVLNSTNQTLTVEMAYMSSFGLEGLPRARLSFAVAPTSGNVVFEQRIERLHELATKTVTTQFLHSSLENMTISAYHLQAFGVGGSASVQTNLPNTSSTGSLAVGKYVATANLPSVLGKTIGDGAFTAFTIVLPIRTTNPFSIAQVQLEEGSVATPFEQRMYGLELSLCQRYFETGFFKHWSIASGGGQALGTTLRYSVQKRVNPTISLSSLNTVNCSSVSSNESNLNSLLTYGVSSTSGLLIFSYIWTASAEL